VPARAAGRVRQERAKGLFLMRRKMIMITNLDVWLLANDVKMPGAGNQTLYNTLLGYARAGWEVHLLTTSRTCERMAPVHDRVFIHRRPILAVEVVQGFKRLVRRALAAVSPPRPLPRMRVEAGPPSKGLRRYARLFRWVMMRRAAALARRIGGVDLVYGIEILGAPAGRAAADRLGVPLVTRFQGTELSRHLDDPKRLLADEIRVAATRTPADLIIMTNDGSQGDKVLELLGVPKEKVRFYMNGVVKDDVYRPRLDLASIRGRLGIAGHEVFILHSGRMFFWKRIDRHLEVLARVRRDFEDFKAVFIGEGPETEGAKALCARLGLADRVRFVGAMPHDEAMNYLNACDVYIAFQDLSNLSNSPLEACVCGKCIVTTAVGGTTDLLTDGVSGVVVPEYDDVEKIAAGLLRVLKDPATRARLAAGAKQRGEALRTWEERMHLEIEEVEQVLRARGNA